MKEKAKALFNQYYLHGLTITRKRAREFALMDLENSEKILLELDSKTPNNEHIVREIYKIRRIKKEIEKL